MRTLEWNRAFALEQAGDEEEMLSELLDLLRETSRADLERIRAAMAAGDPVGMGNAAHSIKGAAASLGVDALSNIAYQIEKAGRSGDLDGAISHFAELESMVMQLQDLR